MRLALHPDALLTIASLGAQLVSALDVGKPSRAASDSSHSGKDRLLRLRVTDGFTTVTCIEVQPVLGLGPDLVPGTKVRLSQAPIRAGVVLLKPANIEVGYPPPP